MHCRNFCQATSTK